MPSVTRSRRAPSSPASGTPSASAAATHDSDSSSRAPKRQRLSPEPDREATIEHGTPQKDPATPKKKTGRQTKLSFSPAFKLPPSAPPAKANSDEPPIPCPVAAAPLLAETSHYHTPQMEPMRKASLEKYRIAELEGAEVYYIPRWVDSRIANKWREEIEQLPQWYRPKLRVYGREITQSRSIAAFATAQGLPLKYSGHDVDMHAPFPPLLARISALLSTDHDVDVDHRHPAASKSEAADAVQPQPQPQGLGASCGFNHIMANSYPDGSTYIGKHADNLENKVIATVSLGAPRTFIFERKKRRGAGGKAAKAGKANETRAEASEGAPAAVKRLKRSDDSPAKRTSTGAGSSGSSGDISISGEGETLKVKLTLGNGSLLIMQGDTQRNYTHEIPKETKIKEPRISLTFRQLIY